MPAEGDLERERRLGGPRLSSCPEPQAPSQREGLLFRLEKLSLLRAGWFAVCLAQKLAWAFPFHSLLFPSGGGLSLFALQSLEADLWFLSGYPLVAA